MNFTSVTFFFSFQSIQKIVVIWLTKDTIEWKDKHCQIIKRQKEVKADKHYLPLCSWMCRDVNGSTLMR